MQDRKESYPDYPGYIKIYVKPLEKKLEREKSIAETNYRLPLPKGNDDKKGYATNPLPYSQDDQYDAKQKPLNEVLKQYDLQRSDATNIVVRCDPRTPDKIIGMGGFPPHPLDPDKKQALHSFGIMNPIIHRGDSSKTGFVSFSTDINLIKRRALQFGYSPNQFIYMAKVPAGILPDKMDLEGEISAVAGVDIEDVIAFRQLRTTSYDPDAPLYIQSNFLRNHPELTEYVMDRFTESDEDPNPGSYFSSSFESKKNNFPKSYEKMWDEMTKGSNEDEKRINKALALLKDYTKNYSRTMRILTFHWNRHHVSEVNNLLKRIETKEIEINSLGDLLAHLQKIKLVNLAGSLARRIKFINEKQSAELMERISSCKQRRGG